MSGKKLRSNKTQVRVLVDFMSTNQHLAAGEFTGPLGPRRSEAQWLKLKDLLKNYGPDRSVEQWKQTWKDLKKKARHENALNALAKGATGNEIIIPIVSEMTQKILDTIGHESSTGIGPAESAIGPISVADHDQDSSVMDKNEKQHASPQKSQPSRKFKHDAALNLLKDASNAIIKKQKKDDLSIFGEAIASELREIKSKRHLILLKKEIMELVYKTKLEILDSD